MSEKLYLYPKWVRIWHWLNAILFLVLILTGISMQYATFIRFDISVKLHNISGVAITVLYFVFLIGNWVTENGKYYKTDKEDWKEKGKRQLQYYTKGIFKNEESPYTIDKNNKFNPLQKVTYVLVMYVGMPLIIITGWALIFPEATIDRVFGTSGLILTDQFHIIIGFLLSIFMIMHIYLATLSKKPGANFRAMATGWHE